MVKLDKLVALEKQSSVDIRYCEIIADATDEGKNERARILKDGERYFFHKVKLSASPACGGGSAASEGEVVACFEIAVDWKPFDFIVFAYTPDDRHIYQIESRSPLSVPHVLRLDYWKGAAALGNTEVRTGDRCEYGGHTVELSEDAIIFDGRKIPVKENSEYTYKLLKTKIMAIGGARGLYSFLDGIAEEYKAGNRFPLFSAVYDVFAEKF